MCEDFTYEVEQIDAWIVYAEGTVFNSTFLCRRSALFIGAVAECKLSFDFARQNFLQSHILMSNWLVYYIQSSSFVHRQFYHFYLTNISVILKA